LCRGSLRPGLCWGCEVSSMQNKISRTPTSIWQKAASVFLGLILFLVLLEAGLRLGGFVLLSMQECGNLRSIKQKGAYRILCLGESTTQRQYPHFLEQALNSRNIGVRFGVIDKGRAGTDTSGILRQVGSYLDEYRPDMVVAMMGINDKGIRYFQDMPDSDTWLFRHCRVYRFGRIIAMHTLKKIKREGLYGFGGSDPGKPAKPEEKAVELDLKGAGERPGPESSYRNDRRLAEAEKPFKENIASDPKKDEALVALGALYRVDGKFSQAADFYRKALEVNPENGRAYSGLGWIYREQDDFPQAEDSFKKAIELDPENDNPYIGLGRLYLEHGKLSHDEEFFERIVELNPGNAAVVFGVGRFYQARHQSHPAEGLFKKTIELDPENDKAYVELARLYRDQRKFSQAEDFLMKAVMLNPENDGACISLATFYRERKKFSNAEDFLKKAIEISPEIERLLGAMSSLYEEMGRPELAKEYAEKANRLRSESYVPNTVNNYRKLKEILDKKRTKLVCVQYPMRHVGPLKKIFEKDEGVIFVDNERVFKEALKKGGYQEYFVDMFGGDFGHCTQKGNELLAQNIADVILREVFDR